ncbi:ABC transporter substrate-binding protein [Bifidobacterium olomucense]|uniref:Dipeptide ABC transporter substrate-binding protein n=1 Tax=Bifidobacterium olomucense TaxID=2675324 RepID=A0A7Y0EZP5_9BIFI|nr:ABC transporter substrate-binding protein [Bifidobacterium sp. DSM 109959]NMM99355.1 dipeptide ABC transporter substrate-binding protein [Bifidobacterium sp. DSM 109959]
MKKNMLTKAVIGICVAVLSLAGCGSAGSTADQGQVLNIGSQMSSFPSLDTGAITSAGYEGQRLIGNLVYEGLTKRDISNPNAAAGVAPALAESWSVSDNGLEYTMKLRKGVTFHDGDKWNSDALIYNINRYTKPDDPNYDKTLLTYYTVLTYVDHVEKVDDYTVKFVLKEPFAFFLADLYNVYFASPKSLKEHGSKGQASHPVGTGPFVFDSLQANQSITFSKNAKYWGTVPKLDKIVVQLIPDASARTAVLRSGRVDWIEGAQPDDLASLQQAGFAVTQNAFDWEWSWQLYTSENGPLSNKKVRQALNYAIDREAICKDLLHGTAQPATQFFAPASLYYDKSDDTYTYDLDKAKQLLQEAGYPNGFEMKVGYITAGSGAMQPKAMNEALQAQLAKVGVKVTFDPVDFSTMYGKLAEGNTGWDAANQAFSLEQPSSWSWSMGSKEEGGYFDYRNEQFDELWKKALVTTDDKERASLLTQAGRVATDDAPWLFVCHDTAPRAMSTKVKGFVQPKSWWIEFNDVYIG